MSSQIKSLKLDFPNSHLLWCRVAGVELISAIFHYQYPGKKKEYQASGNQKKKKKKKPTNSLLRITIEKKCCFNLNFCVVMAFFFILKIHKESTHNSPAVWVCHWHLGSLFLHHFEVRELDWESARWEELWSWGLGEKRCGYEKRHHHYPIVELLKFWFVPSQVTGSLKSIEIKLWIWVSYRVIHQWFQSTITGVYEKIVELVRRD